MEGWTDNQCKEKRRDMWRILERKLREKKGNGEGEGGKEEGSRREGDGQADGCVAWVENSNGRKQVGG